MTALLDIVRERRSIRKYEDRPVSDDLLHQVLEAVRWAPSWTNSQCWDIVVITDPVIKERLQETLAPKNPATKAITGAPVVLALCGKRGVSGYYDNKASTKFGDWYLFDLGIATQTLCLAAHDAGLGTVVVGLFDHDRAKAIVNVPETHELVVLIPMGFPAKAPSAPKRKEISEFVHRETF